MCARALVCLSDVRLYDSSLLCSLSRCRNQKGVVAKCGSAFEDDGDVLMVMM